MIGPVKKGKKWGFVNEAGQFLIPPAFDRLGEFSVGVVSFQSEGKIGFMNESGREVIAPRFDLVPNRMPLFVGGVAAVSENHLAGFINLQGEWVVPPVWHRCWDCVDDKAIVESEAGYFVIDRTGQILSSLNVYEISCFEEWPKNWESFRCLFRSEGRLLAGFVNWKGEGVFAPRYAHMTDFWQGIAGFCEEQDNQATPYGLVNLSGRLFKRPQYYMLSDFHDGLARAGVTPKEFGFVNARGEWAIDPRYRQAQPFSEGLACVTLKGKKGFINTSGELVIEPRFDREAVFRHGFAAVEYEEKRAYIDTTGRVLWEIGLVDE